MFHALLLRYYASFYEFIFSIFIHLEWFVVVEDAPSEELEASSGVNIGANDLLIVGPGVLGRLVAEKWREVWFFE